MAVAFVEVDYIYHQAFPHVLLVYCRVFEKVSADDGVFRITDQHFYLEVASETELRTVAVVA